MISERDKIRQAFNNSALIEYRPTCGTANDWQDCKNPEWNYKLYYYRIKFSTSQNINYLYRRWRMNRQNKSSQEYILIEKMKYEIERLKSCQRASELIGNMKQAHEDAGKSKLKFGEK